MDQKRIALLIGNLNYATGLGGALTNPHNDIQLVAEALDDSNFNVLPLVKDASRTSVLSETKRFAEKLRVAGPGATGFFYYVGHGIANPDDKTNYIIPTNITELVGDEAWFDAVKVDDLIYLISTIASEATRFIILDACRTELRLPYRALEVGFTPITNLTGTFIGFSTSPGHLASDKGDKAGPYATALSVNLRREGIGHAQLFQAVKTSVFAATNQRQLPMESNGLVTDVIFKPAIDRENERGLNASKLWYEMKDSDNIKLLRSFAEAFPASIQGRQALARMEQLRSQNSVNVSKTSPRDLPIWLKSDPNQSFILYATNRTKENSFTSDQGQLSYGFAKIPPDGSGKTGWLSAFKSAPPDVQTLTPSQLRENIRRQVAILGTDEEALIVVPGYNSNFEDSIARGARTVSEVGFKGLPFVFSWPSAGAMAAYIRDQASAELSSVYLEDFVKEILNETSVKKINIIAEGMGAQLVVRLNGRPGIKLENIVFLGPDVDAMIFSESIKHLRHISRRISLYVSKNDSALKVARMLHASGRAGLFAAEQHPLVLPGVETIDASEVLSSWFGLNALTLKTQLPIIRDLSALLAQNKPAAERSLRSRHAAEGEYWVIPCE